jgi:putative ABC transport system permease protein
MRALLTKAYADIRRRKVQSAVVLLIVLLAAGTSSLALTLLSQTANPFDRAFNQQRGAHLQAFLDGTLVTRAQAEATNAAVGASAFAVWPASSVDLQYGTSRTNLNLVGRDGPGGPIEELRLTGGRWASAPDEIVLTRSFAQLAGLSIGERIKAVSVASKPALRLVGEVVDLDEAEAGLGTQVAWVTEAALLALTPDGKPGWRAVYRFAAAPDQAGLDRARARLAAALPPGAVTASSDYLLFRSAFNSGNSIITVTLLAFSVFALAASAAIVVNLVSGVVLAAYREVGVMKAIGYTPGQVVAVFVLQMLAPAAVGCVTGVVAGSLLSQPLLDGTSQALGLPPQTDFAPLLSAAAAVGILVVVALAATLPALRAGLLEPVRAIVLGTAPAGSSGVWLRRRLGRRVPQSVGLGAGDAFARPLRAALTALAVLVGVATVVFAIGLRTSLERSQASITQLGRVQLTVNREPAYPDASVMATLAAQPETARVVAMGFFEADVPGISAPVVSTAFRGDSSQLGYFVVAGRWFHGPGEALAPRALLSDAHLRVGDTVTTTVGARPLRLTIVGEMYNVDNLGHSLFVDWSTFQQVQPDASPTSYFVSLRPGADAAGYARRVTAVEPDFLSADLTTTDLVGPVQTIDSVTLWLAVVLVVIAVAGVFNTVLLSTRERVRDVAVLKAIGMTPAQVLAMVVTSAGVLALIGGALGVPVGLAMHHVLTDTLQAGIGNDAPRETLDVFTAPQVAGVLLAGLVVAMLAAVLPARWAAHTPVVEVLRSE